MILILNTADNEKVFLGLWHDKWLVKDEWSPGRNLSADILDRLEKLYKKAGKEFQDTLGIIASSGPGSFTGLRIGLSIVNAFAYSLNISVVGVPEAKSIEDLLIRGKVLLGKEDEFVKAVVPNYGREPNITKPKKK